MRMPHAWRLSSTIAAARLPRRSALSGVAVAVALLAVILVGVFAGTGAGAVATCLGQSATIVGTSGAETLTGSSGNDVIAGLGGDDKISGGDGNDVICAGSGDDGVNAGLGDDHVVGEDGYDMIVGGAGIDTIEGGTGTDALYGGAGADQVSGDAGSDYIQGGDDGDSLSGGDDDDLLDGNAGTNTVDGGAGSDACDGGAMSACESAPSVPCAPSFAAEFGVRNPARFVIHDTCFAASGRVTTAPVFESDGDVTFNVTTDGTGEVLHIEFVPRDAGHLVIPTNGSSIRLVGVRATDSHGKLEIHPVYQEDYAGTTHYSGPQFAGSPANSYDKPCWREDGTDCTWGGSTSGADATPPSAPRNLIASSVAATAVTLSWQASTDNVAVSGYDVFRDGVRIGTSATTSFTDTNVQPGASYSYTVDAFDEGDNVSAAAGPVTASVPTAGTRILTFIPTADSYTASDAPTTNYGSATTIIADNSPVKHVLTKFDVAGVGSGTVTSAKLRVFCVDGSAVGGDFRSADSSWSEKTVNWNTEPATGAIRLGTLGAVAKGTSYEVDATPLVAGDGQYSVKATSTSGDGAHYSSKEGANSPRLVVTVRDTPDQTPPTAPTNLVATAVAAQQVNLSWSASDDDVGVTGYEILRDGAVIGTATTTSTQDTTAQPGTTYTYTVRAFDAAGRRSDPSNPATVTTPEPPPGPLTFVPTDDATVKADTPTSNSGIATTLMVDGSPVKDVLLKFAVTGIGSQSVKSAKLRLNCVDPSPAGGTFRQVTDTSWTEKTVTWNNAPPAGATVVASLGSVAAGTTYEVDVTPLVQGDGVVSLRVSSSNANGADYSSKEGAAAPQLVVTLGP